VPTSTVLTGQMSLSVPSFSPLSISQSLLLIFYTLLQKAFLNTQNQSSWFASLSKSILQIQLNLFTL
jgi:hypothetical protein